MQHKRKEKSVEVCASFGSSIYWEEDKEERKGYFYEPSPKKAVHHLSLIVLTCTIVLVNIPPQIEYIVFKGGDDLGMIEKMIGVNNDGQSTPPPSSNVDYME